jgi:acyl-CoA thioester hydrolase
MEFRIHPEDIDQLGHVGNLVYMRWVQDIAIAHWNSASTEAERDVLVWVVVRHEIDYKHSALPGDAILVRTWVGNAFGQLFERRTEIFRSNDRFLLASARTLWCPISTKTGKPTRVSDELRRRFSVSGS